MKTKSCLSYFGSDSQVAKDIATIMSPCKHVTIPFCGGMSILPYLSARGIVANDKHELVINFYKTLKGEQRQGLIDLCQQTLSHPSEIADAQEVVSNPSSSALQRAWAFWAICWIARKGKGGTSGNPGLPSVRRTADGGNNATRIRAAADDLEEWAKLIEKCEFESVCFRELIPKVAEDRTCGIYCDPPWPNLGKHYLHQFTESDHLCLFNMLDRFRETRVVVRYGDCEFIRDLYKSYKIIDAASRNQANDTKGELWIVKN